MWMLWHLKYISQHLSARTFVNPDISPPGHFPARTFLLPDISTPGHFYAQTFLLPDISTPGHFYARTFLWVDISLTGHFYAPIFLCPDIFTRRYFSARTILYRTFLRLNISPLIKTCAFSRRWNVQAEKCPGNEMMSSHFCKIIPALVFQTIWWLTISEFCCLVIPKLHVFIMFFSSLYTRETKSIWNQNKND